MIEMKTSELQGAALDWAVAAVLERECGEGRVVKVCRFEATFPAWIERENSPGSAPYYHRFSPSTDWSQGGPLLKPNRISLTQKHSGWVIACIYDSNDEPTHMQLAEDPLIAAMRCLVASKLGDAVQVPQELLP